MVYFEILYMRRKDIMGIEEIMWREETVGKEKKLTSQQLLNLYECRPFKIRNADEYDLDIILDLFVDPTDGLVSPFDYENAIIKGRMGSGKTM
jgi:hypothetical protein